MTESDPSRDSVTHYGAYSDAKLMADEGLIEHETVNCLRLDLWGSLQDHYLAFAKDEKTPLGSIDNYEKAQRWRLSGIEAVNPTLPSLGAVAVDSLVQSVRSGSIRMVTDRRENLAVALKEFVSARTNSEVELGEYDDAAHQRDMRQVLRHHEILHDMIAQSATEEYKGKYVSGPYRKPFANVNERYMQKLKQIHPDLTSDAYHTDNYRSPGTKALIQRTGESQVINKLALARVEAMANVATITRERDMSQTLPAELTSETVVSGQNNDQACSTAVFRMLYQNLTGHFVGEAETLQYLRQHHQTHLVHDVDYLKIFESDLFREEYGKTVDNIIYGGMGISALAKYIRNLREANSDTDVFSIASLRTVDRTGTRLRAQHRVILLEADETSVDVIDSKHVGRVTMKKERFLDRWAATQNSGYILSARDS